MQEEKSSLAKTLIFFCRNSASGQKIPPKQKYAHPRKYG
jgi:hypothetical protein